MSTDKLDKPRKPYRYLTHYNLGDHSIFFGREREIRALVTDVNVSRLVVLFAATGTGKTSLINAGVRPRLEGWQDGVRPPLAERQFATFYVRVTEDPARSIRAALSELEPIKALATDAPLAPALTEVVRLLDRPIVLFLDQFEEFFLYRDPARSDHKRRFIDDVARLYANAESGVHLVLSMREEFLGKMDVFRAEIPTIFHRDSQLRLGWFRHDQARDAIALPPQQFGVKLDDALVEAILHDLLTEDGVEPAQLQIVCHTLWLGRGEGEDTLTVAHYRRLAEGRDEIKIKVLDELEDSLAKRVLGRRFETDLEGLRSKPALDTLTALLPQLCTPEGTKRIREVSGLASTPGIDASMLPKVIQYLTSTHLAKTRERDGVTYIELSHDYLVSRMRALQARVCTLRARRILTAALPAFRASKALLLPEDLEEIFTHADDLTFNEEQARLLFLTSLEWDSHTLYWFRVGEQSGVAVWALVEELLTAHEPARAHLAQSALYMLSHDNSERARALLEKALTRADLAPTAIDAFVNIKTEHTVKLMADLLRHGRHAAEALNALKILARARNEATAQAAQSELADYEAAVAHGQGGDDVIISDGNVIIKRTVRSETHEQFTVRMTDSYTQNPLPFGYIRKLFEEGTIVPFLGSGVNLGARPRHAEWHEGANFLPSASELARYLADVSAFPSDYPQDKFDFLRVASYCEESIGAGELQRVLRRVFDVPPSPGAGHRYLASLPAPLLILTTNFDDSMERAFEEARKPYDLITYDFDRRIYPDGTVLYFRHGAQTPAAVLPNDLDIDLKRTSVIYKLAGSFNRADAKLDSYAVTEDDYIEMTARWVSEESVPAVFLQHIRSRPLLFMGISLDNWYIRALMRALRGDHANSRSWAILSRPSAYTARLWGRQGVQVYDMTVEDFVAGLQDER